MSNSGYDKNLYPFEHKQMPLDGNTIHYVDEGSGPLTLLFCHPSIATSFMYRQFIARLSRSVRCVALDFPGFGLSKASPQYVYSIQSQAEILREFIQRLHLNDVCPVVQEIGGHAALTALLSFPEKVRGIIITSTIIFPISEYKKLSFMLGLVNSAVFRLINTRLNMLIKGTYRFGIRRRRLSAGEQQTYARIFDTRHKRELITHMLHQLKVEECLMTDIRQAFETTFNNTPALLIYGEKDPMNQLGIPQRIQEMLQESELHLIEGEGHFPHEGAPDQMIAIIERWLASNARVDGGQSRSAPR